MKESESELLCTDSTALVVMCLPWQILKCSVMYTAGWWFQNHDILPSVCLSVCLCWQVREAADAGIVVFTHSLIGNRWWCDDGMLTMDWHLPTMSERKSHLALNSMQKSFATGISDRVRSSNVNCGSTATLAAGCNDTRTAQTGSDKQGNRNWFYSCDPARAGPSHRM
jgi:hypothetical protein